MNDKDTIKLNKMENVKTYHHGNLKQALIEAGIEMMNEVGEEGLSLRKIASRCGVSNAAPYAHFESLEDLIHSMQEHVCDEFTNCLNNAVKGCSNPDSDEVILEMGIAYVMFFIEHPQYYKFLYYHEFAKVDLSMESQNNYPPFELLKEQVIHVNKVKGRSVPKEIQEMEILKLWSDVHGLASIASMKSVTWNHDWKETVRKILCYQKDI